MLSGICLTASAIESSVQGDVVQIKDKGAAVSVKNGVVTGVSGADFRGVVNIPAGLGVLFPIRQAYFCIRMNHYGDK